MLTTMMRVLRNKAGNTAMMFGLLLFPIVGMLGLAVDTARAYAVKEQLQTALDAAALAGGRMYGLSTRDQIIRDYFNSNWQQARYNAVASPLTIVATPAQGKLTISASATFPSVFVKFLGIDNLTVGSSVEAVKNETTLEVALAIDTTGSMNSNDSSGHNKMQAARDAANLLLNILYNYQNSDSHVYVSVIPFVQNVNVGSAYGSWLVTGSQAAVPWNTGPYPSASGWKGCMFERLDGSGQVVYDTTDESPVTQKFMPANDFHFGPNCPQWTSSEDGIVVGSCRQNAGNIYNATTAGTTGSTAPTHATGTVSDGTVSWIYRRSAYPASAGYAPVSCPIWQAGEAVSVNDCRFAPTCPNWVSGQTISNNECRTSNGRLYTANTAGTASGTGWPTHASGAAVAGGITWQFRAELCPATWTSGQSITAGDCRRNSTTNKTYIATTSGNTSNSSQPSNTVGTSTVGGITWQFANHNCWPWASSQTIAVGDCRINSGKTYVATTSGTTGATGPTHNSGSATAGGITWSYNTTYEPVTTGNNIYYATVAGTTGNVPLYNSSYSATIADGTASWQLYSRLWDGNERIYFTGTNNNHSNSWNYTYDPRGTGVTSGSTPPTHTSGSVTIGGIQWRYQKDGSAQVSSGGQYGGGYNSGCGTAIVPLTTNRLTAKATVDALSPSTSYGGTMTNTGLIWAWRTISPNWTNLWSGVPNTRPMDYTEPNNFKAVVIMTDGENVFTQCDTAANPFCRGSSTPFGYLADGRLGTTDSPTAVANIDAKVTAICDHIRATGTRIYAVMFDLPAGASDTRTLFTNCAGDPARFFDVVDATQLQQAFQVIGVDLAQLRLSQ